MTQEAYVPDPIETDPDRLTEYVNRELNKIRAVFLGIQEGLYLNGLSVMTSYPYSMQRGDNFLIGDPGGSTGVVNLVDGIHKRFFRCKNEGQLGAGAIRLTPNAAIGDVIDQGNGTTGAFYDVGKGQARDFVYDETQTTWWLI